MPTLTQQDPFTRIHSALWSSLIACQTWAAFVPQGNRVSGIPAIPNGSPPLGATINGLSKNTPNLIKSAAIEPADTPEVRIGQKGFLDDPRYTNSRVIGFIQTFLVQLGSSTPLQDLTPLNQLKWLTRVALFRTQGDLNLPGLVSGFTWGGSPERDADPADSDASDIRVWYAVCPINVHFYIPNEQFMAII